MSSVEDKTNDMDLKTDNTINWKRGDTKCPSMRFSLVLNRFRHYLSSLRPWSFSASLTPVLIGSVLAHKTTEQFSFLTLLATLLTVVSVHAAGNLVNTYCDFIKGIDSKRRSDDRTLVDSILTPEQVVNLGKYQYFGNFIQLPVTN